MAELSPPAKPMFESKTVVAGLLTSIAGALGKSFPQFGLFLSSYAHEILIGLGILAIVLRRVTNGRVILFRD